MISNVALNVPIDSTHDAFSVKRVGEIENRRDLPSSERNGVFVCGCPVEESCPSLWSSQVNTLHSKLEIQSVTPPPPPCRSPCKRGSVKENLLKLHDSCRERNACAQSTTGHVEFQNSLLLPRTAQSSLNPSMPNPLPPSVRPLRRCELCTVFTLCWLQFN